jgi:hypothetical protein
MTSIYYIHTQKKNLKHLIVLVFILLSPVVFSQTVTGPDGPSTAYMDYEYSYGFNVKSLSSSPGSYSLTNSSGTAVEVPGYARTQGPDNNGYYTTSYLYKVTFTSTGTATLRVSSGEYKNVTVKEDWQRAPTVHTVIDTRCKKTVVYRSNNPPPGVEWWWSSDPSSIMNDLGKADSVELRNSTALYVYAKSEGMTGAAVFITNVIVYKYDPPVPTIAGNDYNFEGGEVTLSVGLVPEALTYCWYNVSDWHDPKKKLIYEGGNSYRYTPTKTETLYVSAKNGCESFARLPVTATLYPLPFIYIQSGESGDLSKGSVTLTTGFSYDSYTWRKIKPTGGISSIESTSSTCKITQPGKYDVRVTVGNKTQFSPPFYINSTPNYNYIKTDVVLVKDIKDLNTVDELTIGDKHETIQYFDGLGRLNQVVTTKGAPSGNDVVQPIAYDQYGREPVKYLPYVSSESSGWFKENPSGIRGNYDASAQSNFYQGANDKIPTDAKSYSESIIENSPLNRILKQGAFGSAWQPNDDYQLDRSLNHSYEANGDYEVFLFEYDESSGGISLSADNSLRYYKANQLFANKTLDEHKNEVIEYKDKEDRLICKKSQYATDTADPNLKLYVYTYYIYDDSGDLVVVLPPEGVKAIAAQSDNR